MDLDFMAGSLGRFHPAFSPSLPYLESDLLHNVKILPSVLSSFLVPFTQAFPLTKSVYIYSASASWSIWNNIAIILPAPSTSLCCVHYELDFVWDITVLLLPLSPDPASQPQRSLCAAIIRNTLIKAIATHKRAVLITRHSLWSPGTHPQTYDVQRAEQSH